MQIPILGLGISGKSPNVTDQRRLNIYLDIQPQGDKTQVAAYGTPGLLPFVTFGAGQIRGVHWIQPTSQLFVVYASTLYEVAADGTYTARGTLPTATGLVGMADNGLQLMIVDSQTGNGYIYTLATLAFVQITAAGWPGASSCCFLDGYFIVSKPSSGQFYVSAPYDGTSWNALNFATAESHPDGLQRVYADKGLLVLMGGISTEFWQASGALDFPFARIQASPSAVGLGPGARFTVARCGGSITFLGRTARGNYGVFQLQGFGAVPISTPELEFVINHYASVKDAVAFSYVMNGHDFYQISFQRDAQTWLYDATSGAWSQLQSSGQTRHLANLGVAYPNTILVSDYSTGNLYKLDDKTYTDNGQTIARELIGPHVFDSSGLNQTIISLLRIDMEGGVGLVSGQGSDPQIMLQISRDGGHTWGSELWMSFGKIGEYLARAEWRRLGISRDWLFRLRVTDPVKVAIFNAYIESQVANR